MPGRAMRLVLLLALVLAMALGSGCVLSSRSDSSPDRRALSSAQCDAIDAYLTAEMQSRRIPGLAYGIMSEGELAHVGTHGVANVQHQVPVKPDCVFELASLTKAMTAAAIMLLVEEGRVDLDASIADYLDSPPEAWRPMTVRHVLTHTSGLAPIHHAFTGGITQSRVTTAHAYAAAKPDPIAFTPPGSKYDYSDLGYFVLGMIVERASGKSYREFMTDRIFTPLGMRNTSIKDQEIIVPNEAYGYTIVRGQLINIGRWRYWEIPSAWGVMSTVADLARWDAALYNDSLLSAASRALIFTPAKLNDGIDTHYGFGWQLWNQRGHTVQGHTGLTGTEIVRLPDDRLSVVVLTNLGGRGEETPEVNSWGLAPHIAEMLVPGMQRPPLKPVVLPPALIAEMVGDYASDSPWQIYEKEGELHLKVESDDMHMVYLGDDVFADSKEYITFTLERDASGGLAAIRAEHISGWSERATPRR